MHLVCAFCVVSARSSSSRALDFFIFFAKLLTAFSPHLPSAVSSDGTLRQPSSRFTIGGLKGSMMCVWGGVWRWCVLLDCCCRRGVATFVVETLELFTPYGTAFLSFLSSFLFGGHTTAHRRTHKYAQPGALLAGRRRRRLSLSHRAAFLSCRFCSTTISAPRRQRRARWRFSDFSFLFSFFLLTRLRFKDTPQCERERRLEWERVRAKGDLRDVSTVLVCCRSSWQFTDSGCYGFS
uniref:Putative secreted protein n=1 Tax=Anopheles triannulatus TaxID=58253 RepID=A0A2M4B116_9DIPT